MASPIEKLLADFRAQFPEFDGMDEPVVLQWLETARDIHALSDRALIWCAAHLIVLDRDEERQIDRGTGEVEEDRAGPKRVRFRAQTRDERDTFFTRTRYGRMFLQLERRTPGYAMGVRVYG